MTKRSHVLIINLVLGLFAFSVIGIIGIHFKAILDAFLETIIVSRAYVGFLRALRVTVLLTLAGTLFGTVFGAIICAMRMSRIFAIQMLGRALIAILRGTPVVMLLMFLYFVVFVGDSLDAMYVAMLGYALHSASHMAEIFRTSIEAINPKEIEAARMLGFSKARAFLNITLPQSFKIAMPVYESTIISLIQWTSVAGYISITELTRVIYGFGTRTGDPFFALFLGITIYLGLAYGVRFIFRTVGKRKEAYDKG